MTEVNVFTSEPISCHSFSPDRSKVAISPNNNEVHIYKKANNKWTQETVLNQHYLRVTSIDWAPKTNKMVTCSADMNGYVWNYVENQWKPTLVLLRINNAATVVRWSPGENKFAVGSGDKMICVCYFEKRNDWWVCKHIKKQIMSTVTSLDWHPNNILLGCGSTDYHARIFSAYVNGVDNSAVNASGWADAKASKTSGNCVGDWHNEGSGWVHDVSFSPSGDQLAWVSHGSTICIVDAKSSSTIITCKTPDLPYLSLIWSSPTYLIAAGFDCCPILYKYDPSGKLECVERLDKSSKKNDEVQWFNGEDPVSAMRKFLDMDKFAISLNDHAPNSTQNGRDTIHQNSIKEIRCHTFKNDRVVKISTVGLDGKMVLWDTSRYQ